MKYLATVPALRAAREKSATTIAGILAYYGTVGAVCESSRWLAQGIEAAIGDSPLPIVELGAGYGSVTGVLPERTVSIERDLTRFEHLKRTFPNRTIIDACAIGFLAGLKQPTIVVSSIPSVNNPEFRHLRASVASASEAGTVTTLVTYTYFPHNPFAGIFPRAEMIGMELRNIPPAFLWLYTC